MLLALLRTLLLAVHLVLMDHDTCLTCLWEVAELRELASTDLRYRGTQPPVSSNLLWQHSPEGLPAYPPGDAQSVAALIITENVYDANAGLVVLLETWS